MSQTPEEVALQLARKAARSASCSVIDVLRRERSRRYLQGQLTKLFPDRGGQELKQMLVQLRYQQAEVPEANEPIKPSRRRKPVKGREPAADVAVWSRRVTDIARLLIEPQTTAQLQEMANSELGMDHNMFSQVLAAAEQQGIVSYGDEMWQAVDPSPDDLPSDDNARALELDLPCALDTEERLDALAEAGELQDAKDKIQEQMRQLRAELRYTERQIGECLRLVHVGTVDRSVPCEERRDFKRGQVLTVRLDTLEVVRRRRMTNDDRQQNLLMGA